MLKYDAIVIGGGGGLKIVRPAADLGFKIAIIEEDKLGGTCLNRGCIPSKMLIHPADIAHIIESASRFNLTLNEKPTVHFKDLVTYVDNIIDKESARLAPLMEKHPNIDFYHHHAEFIDDKTLLVNNQQMSADKIIICTGTRPNIPDIEGLEGTPYMTSKEALRLKQQPEKLIILGAGYIACELGHYFAALRTEVHFIVRSTFLRAEDESVSEEFTRVFSKRHSVSFKAIPKKVSYQNNTFSIDIEYEDKRKETLTGDAFLVVTGISPNTDHLGLNKTSVACDNSGYIKVDPFLMTTQKDVYAIGDIIGRYFFRHTANFEGEYLLDALFKGSKPNPIDYPPIPHAIFSNPQVGGVGKKEQELKQEGVEYIVGTNTYRDSAMGMALRSEEGLVKLLFDKQNKRLLGAQIIGEEASNMVHMLIAYMKMQATLDDLLSTIYIHPALPEIIRNAARNANKLVD